METVYSIPLKEASDTRVTGGKAFMLGKLLRLGLPVPNGVVITTSMLQRFLTLSGHTSSVVESALALDQAAIGLLHDTLLNAPWPDELIAQLRSIYSGFSKPVCVRSSAVGEDSATASFAGIYRSSVNVRSFGEFLQAVRDCWASAFDERVSVYVTNQKLTLPLMAVIVQDFVDSVASGIAFVQEQQLYISMAYGLCEGVVSGKVPCDTLIVDSPQSQPIVKVASKTICHLANQMPWVSPHETRGLRSWMNGAMLSYSILDSDKRNAVLRCAIDPAHVYSKMPVLDTTGQTTLIQLLYHMAHDLLGGGNWDVEWCVDDQAQFYLLQARPITAVLQKAAVTDEPNSNVFFAGLPISSGSGIGPARLLLSNDDIGRVNDGDVLVMDWIADSYLGLLSKAQALVIEQTSVLSHCAIIAREWGIPCVGGVPIGTLVEGAHYAVNGGTGHISIVHESTIRTTAVHSRATSTSEHLHIRSWLIVAADDVSARPRRFARHLSLLKKALDEHAGQRIIDLRGVAPLICASENADYTHIVSALLDAGLRLVSRCATEWTVWLSPCERQALETTVPDTLHLLAQRLIEADEIHI